MVISKKKLALSLLAIVLATLCITIALTPSQADVTAITVQLRPTDPEGAGYNAWLLGTRDLDVTLSSPSPYQIGDNPMPRVRDSGSPFWVPKSNQTLPGSSYGFQVIGIHRDDDHGVGFNGILITSGGGSGQIPFDSAVADIRMAGHEITPSDGCGLTLPPSMWTQQDGQFPPSTLPANRGYGTNFTVTPHWGGAGGTVGYVTFNDNTAAGVALYYNGSLVTSSGIPVSSGGLSNGILMILTNENFTGAVTVTAGFTWSSPLRAPTPTPVTSWDYLRVAPLGNMQVCAVGFGGYNILKNSAAPYDPSSMTFADNGTTDIGWSLAGYGGPWHYVAPPIIPQGIVATRDPACFKCNVAQNVAALAYVNSQNPIPTLRLLGTGAGRATNIMAANNVGGTGNPPYGFFSSTFSSAFSTTVLHGTWNANWYYDFDDRPTPNIAAGVTAHQVFVTLDTPITDLGSMTAKRMDWSSAIGDGAATRTEAAWKFVSAIASTVGFSCQCPPNPWQFLQSGICGGGDCITLSKLACAGLNQIGVAATPRYSWPTADGSPNFPPVSGTTCNNITTGVVWHNGVSYPAKLLYHVGGNWSVGWNNFEGFFTIQDPGIKAYTVAPANALSPTNQTYYYLQVLNNIGPLTQHWCANGDQYVPGVGWVLDGQPYPNGQPYAAVPLPSAP